MDFALNQKATIWKVNGLNNFAEATYNAPIVIDVRWEDKPVAYRNLQGENVITKAIIYAGGQADLTVNDCIALGEFDNDNPKDLENIEKIMSVHTTYSVDGKVSFKKVIV
jgi:hypothetical protein